MTTVLLLWFLALSGQQPPAAAPAVTPAPSVTAPVNPADRTAAEYIVGAQDVLRVTIFGEEELSKQLTVDADGSLDYPLIGRVRAGGRTVRQIQDEIRERLVKGGFLLNPTVAVDIAAYRSQTVYVQGAVRTQGSVQLAANASLMSAIAEAGFTTKSGSTITINHRPSPDGVAPPPLVVDRRDLESGRAQNIRLLDGDVITVAEAERFFITGEVKLPGFYEYDPKLTVQQAIILAGSQTDKARLSGLKIERSVNGKTVTVKVKLQDHFLPNDTIIVPRRFF
jgi:polysaccharide export outer membrane protein